MLQWTISMSRVPMRYFRSFSFDVGLTLALIGVLAALWLARDLIAMTLKVSWLQFWGEGGAEAAGMNLSGFVLAVLLAFIGLVLLVVGVVRVRRGAT
jgi:hypothetical protein